MTSHRAILALIREDDIGHDPWGTALSWHFAIADAMTEWAPPYPPADWEYRQALGGVDTESSAYQELSALLQAGTIDASDLLRVGNILHRFEHVCEQAGRSY